MRLEPKVLNEQLAPGTRDLVPNPPRELEPPLLDITALLELPLPALPAPKVDDAEARGVVRALLRGRRERARLAHDVAHVEGALHDVHVVQAQDERKALGPGRMSVRCKTEDGKTEDDGRTSGRR